jgi:hypothetical protein
VLPEALLISELMDKDSENLSYLSAHDSVDAKHGVWIIATR